MEKGSFEVKVGLAEMLKGGVIMDVTTAEQAKIAEDAGAVSVMALERIPADIRADGGIARCLLKCRERLADDGHRSRLQTVRVSDLLTASESQGGHQSQGHRPD